MTNTSYDGNASAKLARELAQEAGPLTELLDNLDIAKITVASGALNTYIELRNIYGDRLDVMPRPGEKDGNNRDEITIEETVDGETKSRKTTFYTVFSDNTPGGRAIVERLEMCNRAKKDNTVKTDIPADIMELVDTKQIGREITRLERKRGTYRATIKRAMALSFQFAALQEVPLVQAEPIWADGKEGEEVIAVQDCIQVWQLHEDEKRGVKYSKDVNISTFLRLDPKKAIEAGGGFKALFETLAREGGQGQGGTDKAERRIASLDTAVGVTVELHRYLNEIMVDTKDTATYDKFIKLLKSNKVTDETVSAYVELRNYLDDIVKAANLQPRWNKLQQLSDAA